MNITETTRIAIEEVKRRQNAERAARFRERHRHRPVATLVDRLLMEATVLALADRKLVDEETAAAIGREVARLAEMGFQRLGYDSDPVKRALAVRLVEHRKDSRGSAVKQALRDLAMLGRVRKVRGTDDVTH